MSDMATYDFIQNKFPVVIFGNLYECPTKADVLSLGGGLTVVGSYGDNECVNSDDVKRVNVITAYRKPYGLTGRAFYGIRVAYAVRSDVTITMTLENGSQVVRIIPIGEMQNSDQVNTRSNIISASINSASQDNYYFYQIEISNNG